MMTSFKRRSLKLTMISLIFLLVLTILTGCSRVYGPSDDAEGEEKKDLNIPDEALQAHIHDRLELDSDEQLTEEDMKELTRVGGLDFSPEEAITDLSGLEYAENLETITLEGHDISKLSPLEELENLTVVELPDNDIEDVSPLAGNKNLSRLFLSNNDLGDNQVEKIAANFNELNWLSLDENNISDISPLTQLEDLSLLFLSDNNIEDISALEGMEQLTQLNVSSNPITDFSSLSDLEGLTTLALNDTQIKDISFLQDLSKLSCLHMNDNDIKDISSLRYLTNLSHLHLSNNNVQDIDELAELDNLEDLDLTANQLDIPRGEIPLGILNLLEDGMKVKLVKSYDQGYLFIYQLSDSLNVSAIEREGDGFRFAKSEISHYQDIETEGTFTGVANFVPKSVSDYKFYYSWVLDEGIDGVKLDTGTGEVKTAVANIDGSYFWGKLLEPEADIEKISPIEANIVTYQGEGEQWKAEFRVREAFNEGYITAEYLGDQTDIEGIDTIDYRYDWPQKQAEFIDEGRGRESVEFHSDESETDVTLQVQRSALSREDGKEIFTGNPILSQTDVSQMADIIRFTVKWDEEEEMFDLER